MTGNDATPRPEAIKPRDFRDIMAVMMNIDLYELEDAGVIAKGNIDNGGSSWKRFNDDPLRFVLKLDDAKLDALTAVVNERRRAVNTFSEREALLREAADFIGDTPLESPSSTTLKTQLALVARIRTALGETAAGEKEKP